MIPETTCKSRTLEKNQNWRLNCEKNIHLNFTSNFSIFSNYQYQFFLTLFQISFKFPLKNFETTIIPGNLYLFFHWQTINLWKNLILLNFTLQTLFLISKSSNYLCQFFSTVFQISFKFIKKFRNENNFWKSLFIFLLDRQSNGTYHPKMWLSSVPRREIWRGMLLSGWIWGSPADLHVQRERLQWRLQSRREWRPPRGRGRCGLLRHQIILIQIVPNCSSSTQKY